MLVIDISINRERHIATVGAVRVKPSKGKVDNDTMCTYSVGRVYEGVIKREAGQVEHLYGDGAEELALKAIECINNSDLTTIEEDNLERLLAFVDSDSIK